MTSEIRVNKLQNRVGLGTVEYTNTGIVVSGIVTANSFSGPYNGTDIVGTGITLTSTTTDSSAGPEFKLFRNSASPADADYLGQIKFAGESDTGVERNYAKITGKILDASNGTEDGIIEFAHIKAGSQVITGRWRSDSLQLLNGTALTVSGNATIGETLNISGDNPNITFADTNSNPDFQIYASNGAFTIRDSTNATNRFSINSVGNATFAGDLDVDGHTNLDNVSIAGVVTATTFVGALTGNVTGNADSATTAANLSFGSANQVVFKNSSNNGATSSNLTFNGSVLTASGGGFAVTGSQNSYLNNNILSFDRAGYSYIDQTNDSGQLVFRVTSSYTQALRLDNSGQAHFASNVLIPDAIQHIGDLDTKIRFPGSNQISFETGNAERMKIDNIGHVTINAVSYQALTITTSENGANGPEIQLMHNTASPAANDTVGQLRYAGKDSAGNITLYGKIETKVDDPTNGQETGFLDFSTRGLSSYNSILRLKNRSTASAPSYTADDINGIILDVYNTGNPYPRYMNFIAKSAGNTDSNIAFWTEAVGGSPTEKFRIKSDGNLVQSSTTAFQIAKGTTAQRPSAITGMVRYNTETNKLEYYDGTAWQTLKTTFDGSGGNSTYTFGGYKIHVFTGNGNFTVTGAGTVDALIVAGGGGAGASDRNQYNGAWSGGGGGGGVLWQQSISVASGTTYGIVVGNGGAVQNNGQNSTAFGYTAIGGGRGGGTTSAGSGNVNWNGASGGSGGGGLGDRVGPMQGGSGTSGQGNSGANGTDPGGNPYYEQGGGGGGAGEAGNTDGIGFGGDGRDMSGEFGTSVGESGYFGGGGAGGQGTDNSASVNSGGQGGGGDSGGGYQNNSYASQAGQANTGGGGGAGGNATSGAGGQPGGSGVVLVRYAL